MKRLSFRTLVPVLMIGLAVLIVGGMGNQQTALAASSQTHDLVPLDPADISAYRWEASAMYYASHQVWPSDLTMFSAADISAYRWQAMAKYYLSSPTRDLTTLNAADISAYRWQAMASYYTSRQVLPTKDLTSQNPTYRLIMIEPGFWARHAYLSD